MASSDDEEVASSDDEEDANLSAGPKPGERVRLEAFISEWALLQETRQQVMLKLTVASSSPGDRLGLDLVAVVDVSTEKLAKMKAAMHFIISKLTPRDRLGIVGTAAETLQFMTKHARAELRGIVDGLQAATNMSEGLQTAVHVLDANRLIRDVRTAGILLISDCKQHPSPRDVETGNVVVHTFGFGQDLDYLTVLEKIAIKSLGGTFNLVSDDDDNLSAPISQILAGLLSVVVQGLKITMWTEAGYRGAMDSRIEKVDAGSYPHEEEGGRFTVSFGDLYRGEDRKVIVDLLLPVVAWGYKATVIVAQCSYNHSSKRETVFDSPKAFLQQRNRSDSPPRWLPPALEAELVRRRHADMLREASTMGYEGAKAKLMESRIKAELYKFLTLNKRDQLHACLLAAITSHSRQRFAAWGDVTKVRLFDTPLMRMYLVQAHKFAHDPDMHLPSADEDVEEEEEEQEEEKHGPRLSGKRPRWEPRFRSGATIRDLRSSWWAWVMVILCTVLSVGAILAGAAALAVFLLYKPKMPYLLVSDAQLGHLRYRQDGTIQSLRVSITILANNNKSKVGASFSGLDIALGFHGATVARLRGEPFVVARESSIALRYRLVSAGPVLQDVAGMNESLKIGLVPLDLFSTARTRWKAGIFIKLPFSTSMSCRLTFFFPGNGTVMPIDRHRRCRSRSP